MAKKKRKSRTHVVQEEVSRQQQAPKSFVIKTGDVGSAVKALVRDVRDVLEPNTASRLRERKSNKVKDYVAMSGPLGVSHMLLFSQSDKQGEGSNVNFKVAKLQRGPTLTFRVLRYSLARDVLNATKRPHSPGKEFATEPMLILNGFTSHDQDRNVKLMITIFQNLFPSIKVQSMALTQARRIVLLSYNATTRTIDLRHYLISVRPIGISKSVRKIVEGVNPNAARRSRASSEASTASRKSKPLPNLADAQDIADYILSQNGLGFVSSASDVESDMSDVEASDLGSENEEESGKVVRLPQDYVGRGNKKAEKRAVKLVELGPRLELGLVKIEDGIDGKGQVLFHQLVHKTAKEAAAISRSVKEREAIRAKRRAEQEANVARKKEDQDAKRAAKREKRLARQAEAGQGQAEGPAASSSDEDEEVVDQFEGADGLDWSDDDLASEGDDQFVQEASDAEPEPEEAPPAKRLKTAAPSGQAKSKFTLKLKRNKT